MQRLLSGILLPLVTVACSATPDLGAIPRDESYALPVEAGTELARVVRSARLATPSGFLTVDRSDDALNLRLALADTAERSIDAQYYIWRGDRTGALLLQRLMQAADRGVRVRILIDDYSFAGSDWNSAVMELHPRVELRVFNPTISRGSGVERTIEMGTNLERLNHRMHNKVFVADNQVALVGGRNIGDEYFGMKPDFNHRDLDLAAVGPIAEELSDSFDVFWNSTWAVPLSAFVKDTPEEADLVALRAELRELVESDPVLVQHFGVEPRDWSEELRRFAARLLPGEGRVLRDRIDTGGAPTQMAEQLGDVAKRTQRDILIVSAYFVPDRGMIEGVHEAVAKGIRIRILTNSLASLDSSITNSFYKKYRKKLLEAGAELYELRTDAWDRLLYLKPPGVDARLGLHAKANVIDDSTVIVGSMNLDPRSMDLNTEIGLVVEGQELCAQVRAALERDLSPLNAWRVELDERGKLRWVCSDFSVTRQPAASYGQRLESFFLGFLPVKGQV